MTAELAQLPVADIAPILGEELLESARWAASDDTPMVGYAIVTLSADGAMRAVVNLMPPPMELGVNRHMFVGMCTEAIREQLVTTASRGEVASNV